MGLGSPPVRRATDGEEEGSSIRPWVVCWWWGWAYASSTHGKPDGNRKARTLPHPLPAAHRSGLLRSRALGIESTAFVFTRLHTPLPVPLSPAVLLGPCPSHPTPTRNRPEPTGPAPAPATSLASS